MKKSTKIFGAILLLLVGYFAFWPVSFEPVSFAPPANPGFEGVYAANDVLSAGTSLLDGNGIGPESITLGPDSLLYTGYKNGKIIQFSLDGKEQKLYANTGGWPLGMAFDTTGNLIVADGQLGLVSINKAGQMTVLTNEVNGTAICFADDLDIAENGMIYFSDATCRFKDDLKMQVWELRKTGRLLSYNPQTKETKVELDSLLFANGVAVGPDDEYLLVSETFGLAINKYWLKGPKKGTKEVWKHDFPCFLDNITYNDNGIFWVAMPLPRAESFEPMFERPEAQEPKARGMVVGLDLDGNVIHNLQDTSGKVHDITSALEVNGSLYLGSLYMETVTKVEL